MRFCLTLTLLFAAATTVMAQDDPPAAPAAPATAGKATAESGKPSSASDKVGYAIGMNIGRNLQQQGMKLDPKMIALGIATILNGDDPLVSQDEIQEASAALQAEMTKVKDKVAADNKAAAVAFLTANAKKEGVQSTKSGMQYIVLKEGSGETPTEDSKVSTHYRGKLISGKVFDESYKGEAPVDGEDPVSFGVTQVIAGWTEALQMMKVGAKYRLFIPPALAYGENGPASIGPNSLLIFDIELVGVN